MTTETLSAELRDELARNNVRRLVDPRHVPVRVTHLAHMHESPAHYLHSVQHGREETLSLRLGIGGHAMLFGDKKVAVYPGPVRRGKEYDAFKAKHADAIILNQREHDLAAGVCRAIHGDMDADAVLFGPGALLEHEVEWTMDGRQCGGRFDSVTDVDLGDLKMVQSAAPLAFAYAARRYHWHAKMAWYVDAADRCGLAARQPVLVAVESAPPHVVQVYRLTDKDYAAGRQLYMEWWSKLMECEAKNRWPGYNDGPLPLGLDKLPGWVEPDDEEETDDGDEE